VQAEWERVLQLLRSALSASSPAGSRRAACVCAVEALRALWSAPSPEARQAALEALPRLAAGLLECAGAGLDVDSDAQTRVGE
jgi:hypothetical protein